jgi:TRAP-type uncharacterized transport system substrate-binding protein
MLQVASNLVATREWTYRQAKVLLRQQGAEEWKLALFGSDSPRTIHDVAEGKVHIATINPSTVLSVALAGKGPFRTPIPLRAIAVIPSLDQLGFAVTEKSGLSSLHDVRERRFPLRVSVRGEREHSLHLILDEVFSAFGFSQADLIAWGGRISYDDGSKDDPHGFRARVGAVKGGDLDAIFDEALNIWVDMALDAGMRFLSLEEPMLNKLERVGLRRGTISRKVFPRLDREVATIDFSGWPVYTHADVSDDLVIPFCRALENCKELIPWQGDGPLPLERMCRDTPEGPLTVPLHPGAERFWRERGYLV